MRVMAAERLGLRRMISMITANVAKIQMNMSIPTTNALMCIIPCLSYLIGTVKRTAHV